MSVLTLLPMLGQVFSAVRKHAEKYGDLLPSKDELANVAEKELEGFNPKVCDEPIVGPEERYELARALSGIILRILGAERAKAGRKS